MKEVRFPLSLRQVEDLLHERGIAISYETVRAWWNRFGPWRSVDHTGEGNTPSPSGIYLLAEAGCSAVFGDSVTLV